MRVLEVWTIGHSTRELSEFLGLLTENRIKSIADVRGLPGSRKFPHYDSDALSSALAGAGIGYIHITQLGGRRRARPDSQNTVWRNASFRGYADYMETDGFRKGVEILLSEASVRRTAVMCAEAVWWRCHRSMIADHLMSTGITVRHIMSAGKTVLHPYTSAAKIEDGKLAYGPN